MKVVIRGTSRNQSEVLPSYLPKRLLELIFRSEGKKNKRPAENVISTSRHS